MIDLTSFNLFIIIDINYVISWTIFIEIIAVSKISRSSRIVRRTSIVDTYRKISIKVSSGLLHVYDYFYPRNFRE